MSVSTKPAPAVPPHLPEGLVLPQELWPSILEAYGTPGRAYHDTRHLYAVLERFAEVSGDVGWEHPREVYLALLFHDAIYDPSARDNEERSAALSARWLGALGLEPPLEPGRVEQLIRLTARHGHLGIGDVTADEGLFLDCDLSIIGADPDVYDRHEADVAKEYAAIPEPLFRAGRRAFLEQLLQRERRFLSPYFHARLDRAARGNLERALKSLEPS